MELQANFTFARPLFCERLAAALKYSGLTSGQLSRLMGWNVSTVRKHYLETVPHFDYETREKIRRMAEFMGISPDWLLFGHVSLNAKKAIEEFRRAAKRANITAEDKAKVIAGLAMGE